ncbi:uncharacterized protein TRAVEDRAFT_51943 [Trametes versicolor FP-101664 SS1]|uniref:uncharacterized protein n=1 Tax=Trametes versicolor (strain FP-101664) TaxID=717944 RepID=UPI00046220DE|nr:uncharacterized protein TRAVEDRAFT_51943 [Trametes versicolor FP-101664 SS1]EIW54227.1 hypothetical protein TRAVEDRAFT_51943 [Trametes versicolor FP-101664 SS1]
MSPLRLDNFARMRHHRRIQPRLRVQEDYHPPARAIWAPYDHGHALEPWSCPHSQFPGPGPSRPRFRDSFLALDVNRAQGVFIEMFIMTALVLAILILAVEKHSATPFAPVGIGLKLFVCHLWAMFYTGHRAPLDLVHELRAEPQNGRGRGHRALLGEAGGPHESGVEDIGGAARAA